MFRVHPPQPDGCRFRKAVSTEPKIHVTCFLAAVRYQRFVNFKQGGCGLLGTETWQRLGRLLADSATISSTRRGCFQNLGAKTPISGFLPLRRQNRGT